MQGKLFITDAAKVIPCHPDTLRRLERQGRIKAVRDYRGFRVFRLEDLLKLREQRVSNA
jgi:DNA-binding transcriptional MerR regulator